MVFIVSVGFLGTLHSGTILAVQTASMVPVFQPGDALILRRQDSRFHTGEIVSYRSRKDMRQIVSHRVVSVQASLQQLVTQGDNLTEPDPPIRNWDVLGKITCIIPRGGYVLAFLYTWPGLLSLIYFPALMMMGFEVRKLCTSPYTYRYQQKRPRRAFKRNVHNWLDRAR